MIADFGLKNILAASLLVAHVLECGGSTPLCLAHFKHLALKNQLK
jgi:hypothetical protein